MFDINLLPESYRRSQRSTPLKMLALAVVIAAVALLAFQTAHNFLKRIPAAREVNRQLALTEKRLTDEVAESDALAAKLSTYEARVEAVRELYRNRIIWAKLLLDIKSLVAQNQGLPGGNLWLSKITAQENGQFSMDGFSTGADRNSAMAGRTSLLRAIDTYQPGALPEVAEMEQIDTRLAEIAEEFPDAASRSEEVRLEVAGLQARRLELADLRSGRVAIQPFSRFIKPQTLRANDFTWQSLGGDRSGDAPAEGFAFNINFTLQPPSGGLED